MKPEPMWNVLLHCKKCGWDGFMEKVLVPLNLVAGVEVYQMVTFCCPVCGPGQAVETMWERCES
jgi:predicted RNA-binding Zn-ribbon protein involved in translation (DUF1610 family)